jgi:Tfp pilus assembly protein PilF
MSRPPGEATSPLDTPFIGHIVVFSGKLASIGRRQARELVERLGGVVADEVSGRTTMLVVGAGITQRRTGRVQATSSPGAQVNAETPGSVRIVGEDEFCRLGGLLSADVLDRQFHSERQIRERYPAVREDHLRYLEKWSLVHPVARTGSDRYYGFKDLGVIKEVSEGLAGDTSFRGVLRELVAARDGQLTLNFSARPGDTQPVKVVALTVQRIDPATPTRVAEVRPSGSAQTSLAARYFHEGAALDEGSAGDQEQARLAYRKALLLDPSLVPALVNLANIYYARDEMVEGQALYERAMHLDPECFEAYFNLGNIHHDLGRYLDALEHYRVALSVNPAYADAHFYLAVTLEKIGHSAEAKAHWRAYRDLAPTGEWVELAKEFSE